MMAQVHKTARSALSPSLLHKFNLRTKKCDIPHPITHVHAAKPHSAAAV